MKAALRIGIITMFALSIALAALAQHCTQTNLVSNTAAIAEVTDPQLVNACGLARTSSSVWWVVNNGTGLVTLYNGPGAKQSLVVNLLNPWTLAAAAPGHR